MGNMIYTLLFTIGLLEEFTALVYYGLIRKGWRLPCSIVSMIRTILWLFGGATILSSFLQFELIKDQFSTFLSRGLFYVLGVGVGNYLSLCCEKTIHEKILKLQKRRGRKKKWWVLIWGTVK